MKILVINCGSSTIKFQLLDMENTNLIAKGRCDKIGYESSNLIYKNMLNGKSLKDVPVKMKNHKEGMEVLLNTLLDNELGVISSIEEIYAIGHRVVHGGEVFVKPTLVTKELLNDFRGIISLAPLHNPGAIMGVEAIMEVAPTLKNVVVCDTAFHQTIPDFNYLYAIDTKYYDQYRIRKYGFHGTSYQYILGRLEELLNKPKEEINAIVCHAGSGASMCAIKNGKSYDTSMGYTPLEGLVMETRSGDIDGACITKIMKEEHLTPDEMDEILNKKSGRLGLSGIGDFRLMSEAAKAGNEKAILARKIQANRNKKYIGSYMAQLNRVDAIVFTGGVCENNPDERELSVSEMDELGVIMDVERNYAIESGSGKEGLISADSSRVKMFVIPTNEELEIAKLTVDVVAKC
ncbi:MAG: acetate kinase [Clostridia bacterium]|nr:acetate kinase [Clostridia bacterium]